MIAHLAASGTGLGGNTNGGTRGESPQWKTGEEHGGLGSGPGVEGGQGAPPSRQSKSRKGTRDNNNNAGATTSHGKGEAEREREANLERERDRQREIEKEAEIERERQREREIRAFREFSTHLPFKHPQPRRAAGSSYIGGAPTSATMNNPLEQLYDNSNNGNGGGNDNGGGGMFLAQATGLPGTRLNPSFLLIPPFSLPPPPSPLSPISLSYSTPGGVLLDRGMHPLHSGGGLGSLGAPHNPHNMMFNSQSYQSSQVLLVGAHTTDVPCHTRSHVVCRLSHTHSHFSAFLIFIFSSLSTHTFSLSHFSPISPPLSLQGGPGGSGHNLGPLSSDLLPPGGLGGTVAATRGLRGVNMPSMGALAAPNGHLMPPMGGQNHNMGGMGPGQGQQR